MLPFKQYQTHTVLWSASAAWDVAWRSSIRRSSGDTVFTPTNCRALHEGVGDVLWARIGKGAAVGLPWQALPGSIEG